MARMDAFRDAMGARYAATRNHDAGPPADPDAPIRSNVSALSPWLRHRLVHEQEVIAAALPHGEAAAKFVSEVLWRGYFRGWLEQRPEIWRRYVDERDAALAEARDNRGLGHAHFQAMAGRTGIDCFDAWARELVTLGWLHNHARMWFASIWIFTLRLPWQLGADFFLRHLIDGDPASNTLSWRWVAGLHTQGKHYLARGENIRRYTDGRFAARGLDETADPLPPDDPAPRVALAPSAPFPTGDYALVLHPEDCGFEAMALPRPPAQVIGVCPPDHRTPDAAESVTGFSRAAVADAATRAAAQFGCTVSMLDHWPGDDGPLPLVAPWMPVGWHRDAVPDASPVRWQRGAYDSAIWPLATAGFFKVKSGAARALAPLGIELPPL
ncbi:FAD-binding domain-containing protein [Sphingomonas sp. CJ99]